MVQECHTRFLRGVHSVAVSFMMDGFADVDVGLVLVLLVQPLGQRPRSLEVAMVDVVKAAALTMAVSELEVNGEKMN
jgi:hypothetical protein